ncbi:hypothetical protein LF887_15075 [Chryseobacterium sp. MEBOG06]|uniref:hypothetical protein n=1 Tax=Chryseobacterium sp. MEBOG06 TaxID=2879938 RepID=UPI001F243AC8|nr:hypothetical protein [Chryseobacterium sp. MEBOG06]UKB82327.1 hypothetical protein LF887_15075 [Chryseobacterium sp. MEBOG06]
MKKFPFTPEGVQSKQKELNALSIDERLKVAEYVSSNPVEFISENFEMSEEQQAYLKELELVDIRVTGFSLAIGFLGQIPVEMQDTTPPSAFAARGKKKKEVSTNVSTTTNPQTGATTVTGSVGIKWTW